MTAQSSAAATARNTEIDLGSAPSVFQLGVLLAALDREHQRLDIANAGNEKAMDALLHREECLWQTIAAEPAVTLADVAVQIGVGVVLTDLLAACCWVEAGRQKRLQQLHDAVRRINLSVLPVIAATAGIDMDAMNWGSVAALRAAEFGGSAS